MGFISLLHIFRVSFFFWCWCNQAAAFAGNSRHPGPCYALALNMPGWLHPGSSPSGPSCCRCIHTTVDTGSWTLERKDIVSLQKPSLSCLWSWVVSSALTSPAQTHEKLENYFICFPSECSQTVKWTNTPKPFWVPSESADSVSKQAAGAMCPRGSRKGLLEVDGQLRAGRVPWTGAEWGNLAPGILAFFPPDAHFVLVRNETTIYSRKTLNTHTHTHTHTHT